MASKGSDVPCVDEGFIRRRVMIVDKIFLQEIMFRCKRES